MALNMLTLKVICLPLLLLCTKAEGNELQENTNHLFVRNAKSPQPPRDSPKNVNESCVCGQSTVLEAGKEGRIVNGQEVSSKLKYPWMVLVMKGDKPLCGGALINTKYVLTASHCVGKRPVYILQVKLGILNISEIFDSDSNNFMNGSSITTRYVADKKLYSGRFGYGFADLALLKLSASVTFSDKISPICLPKQSNVLTFPVFNATIIGWGATEDKNSSNVLREANVSVFDPEKCVSNFNLFRVFNGTICANTSRYDCRKGDSGGPLFHKTNTSFTIMGIAQQVRCKPGTSPGFYTQVNLFVNWIYTLTRGGKYCMNPDNGF